ncbi:MAG TPA: hypothetical protein ENK14_04370 [Caldithrix sp.]|nr:hypothetical protein [Caldithrix sp.]
MEKTKSDNLYSEEISLIPGPEYSEYVQLNLRKIQEFRRNFHLPVIGIAGAEGKTTTKRMIASIISQRGKVLETPIDCNSASVVTSTLLKLDQHYRYVLLELGIINRDQFRLAVEISQPNIGLVTNIGEAHLANLGDKYFIADAKVQLIQQLPADGYAVLNIDDDLVSGMDSFSPTRQVIKYGFNNNAHFHASEIKHFGPDGMEFLINRYYKLHLPIYCSTSVSNALAAVSIARILGFDFSEIIDGLQNNFELIPGRGNLIRLKDLYLLDHTYNATVNTVPKAVESLAHFQRYSKKLILVLGDLDWLGSAAEKIHANLGYYVSAKPIDVVITIGHYAKLVGEGIQRINHSQKLVLHCDQPEALPELMVKYLEPHSTILVTGSKSLTLDKPLRKFTQMVGKT